jgi:hypothetical protein
MLERWKAGAQVVWAVRRTRPARPRTPGLPPLYYWLMRHVVGMKEMPANGADFFLADRAVIEPSGRFPERSVSVLALVMWLGFRQEFIEYDKQPRASGKSGWTLARKITLVVDSVTAFSRPRSAPCTLLGRGAARRGLSCCWWRACALGADRHGHLILLVAAMAGGGRAATGGDRPRGRVRLARPRRIAPAAAIRDRTGDRRGRLPAAGGPLNSARIDSPQ